MWCPSCQRGRRTRGEAAAEAAAAAAADAAAEATADTAAEQREHARRLREEADHIEQQLDNIGNDEQGERATRAWARFAHHLRRLARLRRIWAFLGHYLREIANRRGEPRRRRR